MLRKLALLVCVVLAGCSSSEEMTLHDPIGDSTQAVVSDTAAVISAECAPYLKNAGLAVPNGWQVICPGGGLDERGRAHWGMTCLGGQCPEGVGPYISINLKRIGPNESRRKYVVLHELCHANGNQTEEGADTCAEQHGASLQHSPYR